MSLPSALLCLKNHKQLACSLAPLLRANEGAQVVTFTEASLHMMAKDKKLCACVPAAVIEWGMFAKRVILNWLHWDLGCWIIVCCRHVLHTQALTHLVLFCSHGDWGGGRWNSQKLWFALHCYLINWPHKVSIWSDTTPLLCGHWWKRPDSSGDGHRDGPVTRQESQTRVSVIVVNIAAAATGDCTGTGCPEPSTEWTCASDASGGPLLDVSHDGCIHSLRLRHTGCWRLHLVCAQRRQKRVDL